MSTAPSSYAAGSPEEAAAQRKDKAIAQTLFGKGARCSTEKRHRPLRVFLLWSSAWAARRRWRLRCSSILRPA
jgi:hypothetical protein